ncbi:MAG TPA: hypothetical protein VNX86_07125 [Rhizomicrobium sp.]|jgi:hypothetical protein|nr:hypothetical protein [Rhizomicrobium sp.]
MTSRDFPRVFFRLDGPGDFNIGWGYLSIIDGVPWLASNLDEAKNRIPATMFQLDPLTLLEQHDSETGEQFFVYQARLQREP